MSSIDNPRPTGSEHIGPSSPRVLVVDDHRAVRESSVVTFEQLGAQVTACETVENAITAIRDGRDRGEPFDLVWTDLRMGEDGMAGEKVVDAALEGPGEERKPLVVVSSMSQEDVYVTHFAKRGARFMTKVGTGIDEMETVLEEAKNRRSL